MASGAAAATSSTNTPTEGGAFCKNVTYGDDVQQGSSVGAGLDPIESISAATDGPGEHVDNTPPWLRGILPLPGIDHNHTSQHHSTHFGKHHQAKSEGGRPAEVGEDDPGMPEEDGEVCPVEDDDSETTPKGCCFRAFSKWLGRMCSKDQEPENLQNVDHELRETERDLYMHPAVNRSTQTIWHPTDEVSPPLIRDPAGPTPIRPSVPKKGSWFRRGRGYSKDHSRLPPLDSSSSSEHLPDIGDRRVVTEREIDQMDEESPPQNTIGRQTSVMKRPAPYTNAEFQLMISDHPAMTKKREQRSEEESRRSRQRWGAEWYNAQHAWDLYQTKVYGESRSRALIHPEGGSLHREWLSVRDMASGIAEMGEAMTEGDISKFREAVEVITERIEEQLGGE